LNVEVHVKKILSCLSFIALLLLASCASATDATPTSVPVPEDTVEPAPAATATVPTPDPEPDDTSGYPPPGETDAYPAPPDQAGYPAPPSPPPAPDPYPSGIVWIVRAAGEQCEDSLRFVDLASAVASLEENGITVNEAEGVELMVCQACGCPTSEHYRLQIDPVDLDQAMRLGWFRE
jgi:hypothetical protein